MQNGYIKYFLLGGLAIVIALVVVFFPKSDEPEDYTHITSFHECQEAGFPVLTSYPGRCELPDGRSFMEDITENQEVVLNTPAYGAIVSTPLVVSGKARGTWFFEANLPVTLKDQNGKVLAQKGAQADGDWMTEEFVNFSVTLEFGTPETQYGVLLIEKDNPSGLPENDASYAIPVAFR